MPYRLLAIIAFPAHLLNRALGGVLGQIGLGRVPGALLIGIALAALAAATVSATLEAYEARPEPISSTVTEIVDGRLTSGLWISFEGIGIDGPQVASVEVFSGGGASTAVERVHYLVADPAAPDRGVVVRSAGPIAALEGGSEPVALHGTITEDAFNMTTLLAEWDLGTRHPDVELTDTRLIAYAFETPWQEPSWIGAIVAGVLAAVLLAGALVTQPVLRRSSPGRLVRGETPVALLIHGEVPTPRGPVRLHGTPARLEWLDVEEVARARWRYWGGGLGDMRGDLAAEVRADASGGPDRLVLHGPSASVIWSIEPPELEKVESGDAFLGIGRTAAIRVRADGANATLTFADAEARDRALAELGGVSEPA